MPKDFAKLFNPASIAIVGASRDEKKIGHIVLKNITTSGFKGKIFLLNPKAESIDGLTCYAEYGDLPQVPDLAVMAVPAEIAVDLLELVARQGTKNIVVFSSGFKETGPVGKKLEDDLKTTAEKYGINILGPNCLGFVNNFSRLNVTFSSADSLIGNVRFISQSGALASGIFDWAKQNQIGFSEFITLGNKAVINESDILRYWLSQPRPTVSAEGLSGYLPVGMYLESIDQGREFLDLVAKISATDPIFILKSGQSKRAQQAIQSHTGALAGEADVLDAALKEAGAIRCEGVEDMFDLARIFSWENAPEGPRVAIVTNAGGPGVISVDAVDHEGLQLADFNLKMRERLAQSLPRAASILNPVDVLGDALADRYFKAIDCVLGDTEVDALLVILTPQLMTEIEATAEAIGRLAKKYAKPVVCSFMGGASAEKGEKILNRYKIPSFRFPERAVSALAKMWQWRKRQKSLSPAKSSKTKKLSSVIIKKIEKIIESIKKDGLSVLPGLEADKIFRFAGIKTLATAAIENFHEAENFAKANGWPVVLKISSSVLVHKTESGAVIINIENSKLLKLALEKLKQKITKLKDPRASIQIQAQIVSGLELIVGVKYDQNFGNVLLFGAGGILAELIADKNLMLLPTDASAAKRLVEQSRIYPLLSGFRGHEPYAIKNLIDLVVKLSNLVESVSTVSEITINPVIATAKGAWAVDGRIILK